MSKLKQIFQKRNFIVYTSILLICCMIIYYINYLFFKLPIMGMLLYLIISIVIPSIIAIFCIKEFNKESIVERLREN